MKSILKEILIIVLLCLAILLVLGIIFYNYIPFNKIVPSDVDKYATAENIKNEINAEVAEYPRQNVVFEITDEDLVLYRQTRSYNLGKANPFAAYSDGNSNSTNTNSSGSNSSSSGSSTNISPEQKASSKTNDSSLK